MSKLYTFRVSRASNLPMDLTTQEMDNIAEYETLKAYDTLEAYKEKILKDDKRMQTLLIEVGSIEELHFFLKAIEEHRNEVTINFVNNSIVIKDERVYWN